MAPGTGTKYRRNIEAIKAAELQPNQKNGTPMGSVELQMCSQVDTQQAVNLQIAFFARSGEFIQGTKQLSV